MECFIFEKGVERKAGLEDILPIMLSRSIQYIFRDAYKYAYLPYALAHLPDEMKKLVFNNLLLRIRGRLEKEVLDVESGCGKNDSLIQDAREELISFIGEHISIIGSNNVVWKETKPKEPNTPIEKLINGIEDACASGKLYLSIYDTKKMSKDDLINIFAAFRDRKNELQKIRTLNIDAENLHAASILFEAGGIEKLEINGEFEGTWPEFLENYRNLTSISLNVKGLTESPAWIRNAVSLRSLSFGRFDGAILPDWIGDMQSLTEIKIDYYNMSLKTFPDSVCNLRNLTELNISHSVLKTFPDSICNLKSLVKLNISFSALEKLPDNLGNLISLKELYIIYGKNLTLLPDSIGNLQNLVKLNIDHSALEKFPDSIGNLLSLKELSLYGNYNLISLPDSIGNLKNLTEFYLRFSPVKTLPGCIGNLQNLTNFSLLGTEIERLPDSIGSLGNLDRLSLENCKKIKYLPDSIGSLKNLAMLDLCGSGIDKLPDTIMGCSSLKCLDIRKTDINSFPDFTSSIKELKRTIEVIPKKRSISYLSFCNYYYTLVDRIIRFNTKARREGLLSLEEDIEKEIYTVSGSFFRDGIKLVYEGDDEETVQHVLTLKIERECDYYKKKLMEIALEGVLCILRGDSIAEIAIKFASMVDIKNNPLDAACAKYLTGDYDAFDDIDLMAAIKPDDEREEIRFVKRAFFLNKLERREGIVGIEQHLDNAGIAARDVFEYGLALIVTGMDYKDIDKNLTMLISHETDPVRKNLSLAKKEAIRMIYDAHNPWLIRKTLLNYFDDNVAEEYLSELDEE